MTNASHSPARRLRTLGLATAVSFTLAGSLQAQPTPVAQVTTTQALTATEQAAATQFLGQVNVLSGPMLQEEVRRLAKQFSDQNLNLTAIASVVKASAGNKLGAVNTALSVACRDAPTGSVQSVAVCAAAAVLPDATGRITCPPTMEAVADQSSGSTIYTCQPLGQGTAMSLGVGIPVTTTFGGAVSGGGGGAAGSDSAGAATSGSGTGNGTGTGTGNGTGNQPQSSGSQIYSTFSFSGSSSSSSVGKSVSPR